MTKLDELLQKAVETRAAIIAKDEALAQRADDAFAPRLEEEQEK